MYKVYTLFLLLLLQSLQTFAEKWTPETLPMVHLQDARRYVCNPDKILKPSTVSQADSILWALEKDKGVQTVAVVVNQLQGDDPYQFGMELGRKYGIGSKKQRTGLIIILAVQDRSYQILTGNGLEGALPDAICRRIQNRVMVPELRKQNWDAALLSTLKSIDSHIRKDNEIKPESSTAQEDDSATIGIIIALCFGIIFIAAVNAESKRRRCPSCRQAQMRIVSQQRVRLQGTVHWAIRITMRCPRCGHEKVYYKDDNNINTGGTIPPPFFMGGFGNHSSGSFGGGFSGGSFGGGSFGGGGSGGRF